MLSLLHGLLQLFLILLAMFGALAISIVTVALGSLYGPIAWTIYASYILPFFGFGWWKGKDRPRESSGDGFRTSKLTVMEVYLKRKESN